jgi:hypothetical protein
VLIVASAVLLVLGVLAYRRQLGSGGASGLLVLRLLVLAVLAGILTGAVASRTWAVRPRHVAVMVDRSLSMSILGLDSAAAAEADRFPLPVRVARDRWVLADSAVRVRDWHVSAPGAQRTRLGRALELAGKTRPGAILVLSDGQDNGEVQTAAAAARLGVPVYAVGFGPALERNLAVARITLPAVIYAGDTVEAVVRIAASGFQGERAGVRFAGETREVALGENMTEQELVYRVVFSRAGRQTVDAAADSVPGELSYADNVRSVIADVRPNRYRVTYITDRPGPSTRFILGALASDERLQTALLVPVEGRFAQPGSEFANTDVFILDGPAERAEDAGVWQAVVSRVKAGAGALLLAGPGFQPGAVLAGLVQVDPGARSGTFTPELTPEARILPWFAGSGSGTVNIADVPPFIAVRPAKPESPNASVWLTAQAGQVPLMSVRRAGKGKVLYVAGYPFWRWGFGPDWQSETETPLAIFLGGVVHFLAESDTNRYWLEPDKPGFLQGEPVHLTLRAVSPDGRPWGGLRIILTAEAGPDSVSPGPAGAARQFAVPMTETGSGTYEAALDALAPGEYRAAAAVALSDSVIGRAVTGFAVAPQSIELASTGLNEGLLRAIAEASRGRYFSSDSLPGEGFEMSLGSYRGRFTLDPRRTTFAYVLVALLAGLEWFLRRRRGLL